MMVSLNSGEVSVEIQPTESISDFRFHTRFGGRLIVNSVSWLFEKRYDHR